MGGGRELKGGNGIERQGKGWMGGKGDRNVCDAVASLWELEGWEGREVKGRDGMGRLGRVRLKE